jgi:mannose-6-phosphate isomerase-like protein (cupin superfamily)
MKVSSLKNMVGGWFVGDFSPAVLRSTDFESAVKYYRKGDKEPRHHHKMAEEVTVVAAGRVRMCDRVFEQGDIVHLEPGMSTAFEALEDAITVVVKRPSVADDKHLD